MAKLIVITTGGTIASVLNDGVFAVAEGGSKIGGEIQAAAESLGLDVEVVSPLNKNSESFTPADWLDLLTAIREACAADIDGVVVLHGTDTMEYSLAAACSFAWSKRVCFTGAMLAPELDNSDAHINLLAAMSFAANSTYAEGVYLAFRSNADNLSASIFHGSEVKPLAFDEDGFRSVYGNVVATYPKPACPVVSSDNLPSEEKLITSQQQVAYIKLYPGIDLNTLQALSAGRSVVVIELYHSGTGPASADYDDLIQLFKGSAANTLFALSAFPSQSIQHPYASTLALMQAGGVIYADLQPHYLYVFCLLMVALGKSVDELKEQLGKHQLTSRTLCP